VSIRGDKPVTVSMQTEARGAHLKQQDDWPTAIAGQRFCETAEAMEVEESRKTHQKLGFLSEKRRHSAAVSVTEPA